jgi:hypothetical protein
MVWWNSDPGRIPADPEDLLELVDDVVHVCPLSRNVVVERLLLNQVFIQ